MTEAQDGILWRLARLHPGWMTVPVVAAFLLNVAGFYLAGGARGAGEAGSLIASVPLTALTYIYAFLVATLVAGRFHSRHKRRLGRLRIALAGMLAGFFGMPLFAVLGGPLSPLITERSNWGETALLVAWGVFVACGIYMMVRASLDLVEAERGFGGGAGRKLGTLLLFFFWLFGVFFIQARLRRLILKFAAGDVVRLPMEKLELFEEDTGKLALTLSESVSEKDFNAYGKELIQRLDGHILKRIDGGSWKVEIEGSNFLLRFDPPTSRVSLAEQEDSAALLLARLQRWLAPAVSESARSGSPQAGAPRVREAQKEG